MDYSLENAQKFNWSSVTGNLDPERVSHLETYLVGKKILDAGCSGGAYVDFLARKGLEVTGVDKYDQFLAIAREKGLMGTYVQGDVTNLPFADKTFDCTYCFDVLEHVDDWRAIQELTRVTTKRLILAVPQKDELMNQFGLTFITYQDPTHLRYYTEDSLRYLVSKIPYSEVKIFAEGIIPLNFLFKEMLEKKKFNYSPLTLRPLYKLKFSNFLLNKIMNKIGSRFFNKLLEIDNSEEILISYITTSEAFKKMNLGLVAVVELDK